MSKQWQCGQCSKWVPAAYYRHCHVETVQPTMAEMIAARETGRDGLATSSNVTTYQRTGKEPLREEPDHA